MVAARLLAGTQILPLAFAGVLLSLPVFWVWAVIAIPALIPSAVLAARALGRTDRAAATWRWWDALLAGGVALLAGRMWLTALQRSTDDLDLAKSTVFASTAVWIAAVLGAALLIARAVWTRRPPFRIVDHAAVRWAARMLVGAQIVLVVLLFVVTITDPERGLFLLIAMPALFVSNLVILRSWDRMSGTPSPWRWCDLAGALSITGFWTWIGASAWRGLRHDLEFGHVIWFGTLVIWVEVMAGAMVLMASQRRGRRRPRRHVPSGSPGCLQVGQHHLGDVG